MRAMLAIARRELGASFGRPVAYAVLAGFLGLFGLLTLWFDDFLSAGVASLRRPLWWLSIGLVFVVPASTMRVFAEERRSGTWQILWALPISSAELVLGKWLGAVAFWSVALATTLPWPVALWVWGDPDPGALLGGYFGIWLVGSALAAVGVATSAATDSQVAAFLGALAIGLVPWLVGNGLPLVPPEWVSVVQTLTFEYHFANLARGVLDSRSVVFFVVVSAFALRTAVFLLDRQRLG